MKTSMETSQVLHRSGNIHTPTGQLILTATVLDDLIAIMLLGELQALHDDKQGVDFIWPVISPILGVVIVGYLALHIFPDLIECVCTTSIS